MSIFDWFKNDNDVEVVDRSTPAPTYIGTDGVERTQEEYDAEKLKALDGKGIYAGTSDTPPTDSNVLTNDFTQIPWGSNQELNNILNKAGDLWNVPSDVFKLLGEAEYTQGYDSDFKANPTRGAAVLPSIPRMLLPNGELDYSNVLHELPHLSSKYFRNLEADGSVRPDWQKPETKGLTGYEFSNKEMSPYYDDFMGYVENDPTSGYAAANFDQRAYNFTQSFLNEKDRFGHEINVQRPELRDAIGNAMGNILADDRLFNDSMLHNKDKLAYATSPEEIYARAMNTYGKMKVMSIEEREKHLTPVSKFSEWRANNPGIDSNAFIQEHRDYEALWGIPTGKVDKDFLPYMRHNMYKIRPETYNAIDAWMKVNKPNETNDGFAQLELDNYLEGKMYA